MMPPAAPSPRLSSEFARLAALCRGGRMTLGELLPGLAPRDQALLTAALSVCFCHPVPLPGLSTLCGLVIALAGGRMALGLNPWVPRRWRGRPLPARRLEKVFAAGARLMRKSEWLIKPRGVRLCAHPWTQRASGGAITLCGLLLAAPAPPGTAMPPAAAILLISVGTLESDALFLAAGYAALALNIALFGAMGAAAWRGARMLLH